MECGNHKLNSRSHCRAMLTWLHSTPTDSVIPESPKATLTAISLSSPEKKNALDILNCLVSKERSVSGTGPSQWPSLRAKPHLRRSVRTWGSFSMGVSNEEGQHNPPHHNICLPKTIQRFAVLFWVGEPHSLATFQPQATPIPGCEYRGSH